MIHHIGEHIRDQGEREAEQRRGRKIDPNLGKRGEIAQLLETIPEGELDWALELLSIGKRILERRKATAGKTLKKASRRVVAK